VRHFKENSMRLAAAIALVLLATPAAAQLSKTGGGPVDLGPLDDNHTAIDALHRASVSSATALGPVPLAAAGRAPNLQFPVRLRAASKAFSGHHIANYVDLDKTAKFKDFTCSNRTYDGHNGTDFVLSPFWWRMMDGKEADVVAAAPGKLIAKDDGNFDRQCNFNGASPGNYVVIQQDDGYFAYYFHMKKKSVTTRSVGSRVAAGDVLGLIGSSGTSLLPHLHFELRTASFFGGQTVDPFAGACGAGTTIWKHQPEKIDTEILRIATHKIVPPRADLDFCANPDPGYSDQFLPGAKVWVAAYVRDQAPTTPLNFTILRPDGTTFTTWSSGPLSQMEPFTYWYGEIDIPPTGPEGRWKAQVQLEGKTDEHVFMVGDLPAAAILTTSVTPSMAAARPSAPANFDVTVRNSSSTSAIGCSVAPDAPLAAVWSFQQTVAGTPTGGVNEAFDIPAGKTAKVRLTITPKATYRAQQIKLPIRVFCPNGSEAATARAKVITLSF
jgi:murein DD-endopeptidase MepM/ murein hydrolase activator NlpD